MSDQELLKNVVLGDRRAFSALLSLCESDPDKAGTLLSRLKKSTAHVIGITGSPGVGKSALINGILDQMKDARVGVMLVDPSSPFSGGALLGDRVRMQGHAISKNCFIRSFASRRMVGGLSPSVYEACDAFEAFGMRVILVETLGTGQSEVEVANLADTVIVVLSPDSGDEVQLIKAGIMEIADIFVINKSDRPSAQAMFSRLLATMPTDEAKRPIYLTNAITGEGISEMVKDLSERFEKVSSDGTLKLRRRKRLIAHAQAVIRRELDTALQDLDGESICEIRAKLIEKFCAEGNVNHNDPCRGQS